MISICFYIFWGPYQSGALRIVLAYPPLYGAPVYVCLCVPECVCCVRVLVYIYVCVCHRERLHEGLQTLGGDDLSQGNRTVGLGRLQCLLVFLTAHQTQHCPVQELVLLLQIGVCPPKNVTPHKRYKEKCVLIQYPVYGVR